MKPITIFWMAVSFFLLGNLLITECHAATKCERDYTGGICCWDTNTEGPYKPINC
jgi:hypothetical protein